MKSTKRSLLLSTISLVLCFAMLLGTTWAWFTDEVTSGKNQIVAGNLDVELYHSSTGTPTKTDSEKVTGATNLFHVDLWEPGVIAYENFTVANVGSLAFKYKLSLTDWNYNTVTVDNVKHNLSEVIKIATVAPGTFTVTGNAATDRAAAQALFSDTSKDYSFKAYQQTGVLYPVGNIPAGDTGASSESSFGVILYWEPTDNDNIYNINNGKHVSDGYKINGEEALWLDIGINLVAMQKDYEADSFDNTYDIQPDELILPDWSGESEEVALIEGEVARMEVKVNDETKATAEVEAGTKINGAELNENEKLKLTVVPDNTPNGVTVDTGNSVTTYDVSLIKVVTTEATDTSGETKTDVKVTEADKPVLVSLDIGVVDLVDFYHHGEKLTLVENKENVDVDKYFYEIANGTGTVYFKTKSFSPFASVYKFAGGLGTDNYPYLLANAEHWDAFYQAVYDWEEEDKPYFKLMNDIDLTDRTIKNYAMDSNNQPSYGFFMKFDLDGNGHALKNITTLDGYCQPFPYIWDTSIHDITIDYNLDETRTAAMVYYPLGDNYFTDVTTTGSIETTADWATPYVAYMYKAYSNYNCNVTYKNCTNYANIKGGYGNSGYTAVFGSHNGGGGHITFDNCANYGGLLGGHVGFVGMGNDTAYTFVDENAVKNFGSAAGTKSVGYFNNSGDAETKTIGGITCQVKQEGATKKMSTTHTTTLPENFGEVISIDEVTGATKYDVQMSFNVGVYNYSTVGPHWGGGFPRHLTFSFTDQDVINGKIATPFRKAYLGEVKADQYYGYYDTKPTYDGIFLPDDFSLDSNDVKVLENQGDVYLVEYKGNVFYVMYSSEYHGWYALLSTNDAGEITTKDITVSYSVTAYNPDGSVLSFSSTSYYVPVDTAKTFFNQLAENSR